MKLVLLSLLFAGVSCESWTTTFFEAFQNLSRAEPSYADFHRTKAEFINAKQNKGFDEFADQESLPYFKIFPKFMGSFPPDGSVGIFENFTCFQRIIIETVEVDAGIEMDLTHTEPDNLLCHRSFVISTGSHFEIVEVWGSGKKTFSFERDGSPEVDWDLLERGPRVFMYPMTPETLTYNLAATAALFEPVLTQGVMTTFADMNREFLQSYAGIVMEKNDGPESLDIPEDLIKNGDTFDIMRLDGLDPMIAYAMGAATGHTAVALWRDGSLYICESNAKSAYWPVNGIQCNPYREWIEYGRRNNYNTVWAPLKPELSASLDVEAAWEFVDSMYGIDYGYEVVLMGWLDTLVDNLPCVQDTQGDMCMEPEHFEMLFSYLERISTEVSRVYKPAILQRAGVPFNSTILQAMFAAHQKGIIAEHLYTIPEQDGWLYETTRDGSPDISEVAICNVFVCRVWKAAGLFAGIGDEINCGETSVNDNYRLNIYADPDERPAICQHADPYNPNCQVLGRYKLRLDSQPGQLPRYNYVNMTGSMFQSCPSKYPDYLAPTDC